jgi:hypothetical protein
MQGGDGIAGETFKEDGLVAGKRSRVLSKKFSRASFTRWEVLKEQV